MSFENYREYPPVENAWAIIMEVARRYPPESSRLPLSYKLTGRVLAQDVTTVGDIPAVRTSSEDGYATMVDFSGKRKVVGESTALSPYNQALLPGECVRIEIGGAVPAGADTVVLSEDVTLSSQENNEGETIEIKCELLRGENIREPGSDAKAGEVVLPKGFRMDSTAVRMLIDLNVSPVEIFKKSKVCVVAIGNERNIQDRRNTRQLRANIRGLFHEQGFEAIDGGTADEELYDVEQKLHIAARFSCVIVTFGGKKLLREYIRTHGLVTVVGGVRSFPGNISFAHGSIENKPVFLCMLPKDFSSAWIGANLFVSPVLRKIGGRTTIHAPRFRAMLTRDYPVRAFGVVKFLRGKTERRDGGLVTTPLEYDVIRGANSIILIPPGTELVSGRVVDVMMIIFPSFVF